MLQLERRRQYVCCIEKRKTARCEARDLFVRFDAVDDQRDCTRAALGWNTERLQADCAFSTRGRNGWSWHSGR